MNVLQRHESPDGELALIVIEGNDGEIAVGFEGNGAWHTHPDALAGWLGGLENSAVDRFIQLVLDDRLPIITTVDAGASFEPWVSDDLPATLEIYGRSQCRLRLWSGREVSVNEP